MFFSIQNNESVIFNLTQSDKLARFIIVILRNILLFDEVLQSQ